MLIDKTYQFALGNFPP